MKRLLLALMLSTAAAAFSPAYAVDTTISKDAPDLSGPRAKIAVQNYKGAITDLTRLLDTNQHADLYNLLGYSYRKSGDTKQALTWYHKALDFDPAHKGALEYLGELYVELGDLPKARVQLAQLQKLCPQGCEERADLEQALAKAKAP